MKRGLKKAKPKQALKNTFKDVGMSGLTILWMLILQVKVTQYNNTHAAPFKLLFS
jgi:hypothetical protein